MGRGIFEGWHLIILVVLVIVLFGAKRLPDAARGLGRSMRVFKSEVDEMKKPSETVKGETVSDTKPATTDDSASAADVSATPVDKPSESAN